MDWIGYQRNISSNLQPALYRAAGGLGAGDAHMIGPRAACRDSAGAGAVVGEGEGACTACNGVCCLGCGRIGLYLFLCLGLGLCCLCHSRWVGRTPRVCLSCGLTGLGKLVSTCGCGWLGPDCAWGCDWTCGEWLAVAASGLDLCRGPVWGDGGGSGGWGCI